MKTILFNASTNVVGGGIKNAALFLKECVENKDFNWHFIISSQVNDFLKDSRITIQTENLHVLDKSPAKSKKVKKDILAYVIKNEIDLVYTMAGPAYVKFPCVHVQGISNAYITHADWATYKLKKNVYSIFRYYFYTSVQFFYSLKADHFVFQTDFAKNSYKRRSGIKDSRLHVIPNAFDTSIACHFLTNFMDATANKKFKQIQIFCPGAAYLHKGFQFLPAIIEELKKSTKKIFKFIVTLPEHSAVWGNLQKALKAKNVTEYCENIGPYKYSDLVSLLDTSDIVFVPSLLETFSASYLEAMCAKKKLIVADKSFAREVCDGYGIYVNPLDSIKTAKVFNEVFNNLNLNKTERALADRILSNYGDQHDRSQKIISLIKEIVNEE